MEWVRNQEIFTKYSKKLKKEVPMMALLPITTKTGPQFKWPDNNKYPLAANSSSLSGTNMALYFNKILPGHKISVPEPDLGFINQILLITIFVSVFMNFYQHWHKRSFWMWVCYFIIWFSICGTFWNLNRGPPLTYGSSIIYPQQRQQTLVESFLAGTLILLISGVFVSFDNQVRRLGKKPIEQKQLFYKMGGLFTLLVMSLHLMWIHKAPGIYAMHEKHKRF